MDNQNALRILIIDDTPEIHQAFLRILVNKLPEITELDELENQLFSSASEKPIKTATPNFQITSVNQGIDGLEAVKQGIANSNPYALAFVDIRMPPGWDGIKTIQEIWKVDSDIQIVICTAYSDYTWENTVSALGEKDNLLILKKPFDTVSIRQLTCALTKKWQLANQTRENINQLEGKISEKTQALETSLSLTRSTLDSSQDAILVVGYANNIIDYNQKITKFWNFSETLLQDNQADKVLFLIAQQLTSPEAFLAFAAKKHQGGNSTETFKTSNNYVIEVNAHIYRLKEKNLGLIFSFRDITARAVMEEKIQFQATHDPLTCLANRILLFDKIQYAINQADRENTSFCVLFIDLNRFKLVNDSLGHAAGDQLLVKVAKRLQLGLRKTDILARIGGDEFVIVSESIHIANNEKLVQKTLSQLEAPFIIGDHKLYINASIGVALYPNDGKTPEELVTNADTAMYASKEIGGNRSTYFKKELQASYQLQLQFDFNNALKNNEFFIHYQPQYDLTTKSLHSIEALVRWQHPVKGLLIPTDFIELAEDTGFIIDLGNWILREVCLQNKAWQDLGLPKIVIAVNMGTKQLKQPELINVLKGILHDTQLEPQYLEVELTENVFINLVQTKNIISELKKLGIKITLDDFGAGFSSLNYLRKIQIDRLKIDKSFIDHIGRDNRDEQIIEAIISMGAVLNFNVVAEGVETQSQINFLKLKNCVDVQGYFFSKPMASEQIIELLQKQMIEDL